MGVPDLAMTKYLSSPSLNALVQRSLINLLLFCFIAELSCFPFCTLFVRNAHGSFCLNVPKHFISLESENCPHSLFYCVNLCVRFMSYVVIIVCYTKQLM